MSKTFNETYADFLHNYSGDHKVVACDGVTLNAEQFKNRIDELTAHLAKLGIRKGMGVGYCIDNCSDNLPLFIAIARLGAYAVPQFFGYPDFVKTNMFKNTGVKVIVAETAQAESLKKLAEENGADYQVTVLGELDGFYSLKGACSDNINLNDVVVEKPEKDLPLLIASSSGTTGIPKLVRISQENFGSEILIVGEMVTRDRKPANSYATVAAAFPLSTSVISIILGSVFIGDYMVYSADTSPMTYLKNIQDYKCTYMCAPPAYYEALLIFKDKCPYDLSSLGTVGAGMDFCPPALLKRLRTMFKNLNLYVNGYGLVETSNVFMHTAVDLTGEITGTSTLDVAGCVDNIIKVVDEDGNEVKVGETGQLLVKGPSVINGYMKAENNDCFEDGWFKSGDIVRLEGDRKITLLGRQKYFIKRGGKSVSPIVVQDAINKTPGIKASGVVGAPHPLFGEMIWAFVVKEQGSEVSLKDIKAKCKEILPVYMLPDQVEFIDAIPMKKGVGKVDFETLKEMAKQGVEKISFK